MSSVIKTPLPGTFYRRPSPDADPYVGEGDAVNAGDVDEADHRPGSAPNFDEYPFNDVCRPHASPQVTRQSKEGQQFREIAIELANDRAVLLTPFPVEVPECNFGCFTVWRLIDSLGISLHLVVIALADFLKDVPHLVYPATLVWHGRVNRLQCSRQTRASVGDYQAQFPPQQSPFVQLAQQTLPGLLALSGTSLKSQQVTCSVLGHCIGDQHVDAFPAARPAHPQAHAVQKQIRPAIFQLCLMKLPHSIVQLARQF